MRLDIWPFRAHAKRIKVIDEIGGRLIAYERDRRSGPHGIGVYIDGKEIGRAPAKKAVRDLIAAWLRTHRCRGVLEAPRPSQF